MIDFRGQEVGDYKLLRLLGQSNSRVYLAQHKHSHSYAAMKIYRTSAGKEQENRGDKEAFMLSNLIHPHIIQSRQFDSQNNIQFLIMDWAAGGTLHNLFRQNIPISMVTTYVKQIACALQYLHTMHIIHRDIKSTNILIDRNGNALLADFELATDYRYCQSTAGTATHIAPEQKQGYPCPASDQYAVGVLVYQWLYGELPFIEAPHKTTFKYKSAIPHALSNKSSVLPYAIERIVLTALARDPSSRFVNIQKFADTLEQACQSLSYLTPSQSMNTPKSST